MITINENKCIGCGLCVKDCFTKDIEMTDHKAKSKRIRCIVLQSVQRVQLL